MIQYILQITIQQGEYLTVISGYYSPCITALTFITSAGSKYGPYGKDPNIGETSFKIDAGNDSIVALFGHADNLIKAIGAYTGPRA
jgi:hypothetical protein